MSDSATPRPSLAAFLGAMLRVGNTTFGGGIITMIMIGREIVERRRWLKPADYDLAFALSRVTPGTNIIAFCAAVGSMLRGWPGAIGAVLAVTAPSALVAVLLMQGFEAWHDHPWAMAALAATTAAVTGMMWATVWMLTRPHLTGTRHNIFRTALLFTGCALAAWVNIDPLAIILVSTVIGMLWIDPEPQA